MIAVQQLCFAYPGKPPLFDRFDLTVAAGEAWSVIGPSGCGKSTLLRMLAGLQKPDGGSIRIDGRQLTRPRPRTGFVLQDHGLLPWFTVRDNVRLGLSIRGFYGPDGRHAPPESFTDRSDWPARVDEWMQRLGIAAFQRDYPLRLSRGQRQRVALARTLVLDPDLLLLDEPFSALDAPTRDDLHALLDALQAERRRTRLLVTHDIQEAVRMGERILVLGASARHPATVVENRRAGVAGIDPGFGDQCRRLHALLGAMT
jgi:NitT/TauT family transport system ATP-binding protein